MWKHTIQMAMPFQFRKRPFEASPDPMTRAMKRMTTKKRRWFVEYVTSGKRSKRWQAPSPLAALTQEEITEQMRALAKEMRP